MMFAFICKFISPIYKLPRELQKKEKKLLKDMNGKSSHAHKLILHTHT